MKFADVSLTELAQRLRGPGVDLPTGPFVTRIKSPLRAIAEHLKAAYSNSRYLETGTVVDYQVSVEGILGWSLLGRPKVRFVMDDTIVALRFPRRLAVPMLEWGLNWCIYHHAYHYLIIHAAVVERQDQAVILSAPPGSGKSTLCAGLTLSGWRLLSDELALLKPEEGLLAPLARPVCLKNESVEIISQRFPHARMGPAWRSTHKGTVAHLFPTRDSTERAAEPARPAWIVFPRFVDGAHAAWSPISKGRAMMQLISNCFNYYALGGMGFQTLADLVERCECYEFRYGNLGAALQEFDSLVAASAPEAVAV